MARDCPRGKQLVSESSNSSTHSMNVMKDKMEKMQQKIADMRSTVTNFMELDPPSFKGTRDPVVAKAWIQRLEKLFEILQCMDKQKVELAVYIIEGERKGKQQLARCVMKLIAVVFQNNEREILEVLSR